MWERAQFPTSPALTKLCLHTTNATTYYLGALRYKLWFLAPLLLCRGEKKNVSAVAGASCCNIWRTQFHPRYAPAFSFLYFNWNSLSTRNETAERRSAATRKGTHAGERDTNFSTLLSGMPEMRRKMRITLLTSDAAAVQCKVEWKPHLLIR